MPEYAVKFNGTLGVELAGGFVYLPFKVPKWAKTVEVQYSYRGLGKGECILDIGIFEPCSLDLIDAMDGFRGWSGSNKKSFYVSEGSATPGYLPGPLKTGVWHVVLGLYKVPPEGCWYEVEVKVSGEARYVRERRSAEVTSPQKSGWMKGDFHVHSIHSDGNSNVEEIALEASRVGLDFVAVTDHNTHSHITELNGLNWMYGELVVGGVEVTTYKGHFNVYNVSSTPEFRIRSEGDLLRVVDNLRRKGALISVNHPKPLGPDWEWGSMSFAHFIEVYHSLWGFNNYISLRKWDEELRKGYKLGLLGGSDAHSLKAEGLVGLASPTTWVLVDELSERGLLEALTARRTFVSKSPQGPRLELHLLRGEDSWSIGEEAPPATMMVEAFIEGGRGTTARLVSDRCVEHVWKIERDPFSVKLEMDLRDVKFLRLETLETAEDPWDRYHRENDISAISSPIYIGD